MRYDGTPLSPAWQSLYDALPSKWFKNALSRFLHYSNQRGLMPDQVDQAFLDSFVADHHASGEVANVQRRHRDTALLWNQCANTIPGWPQVRLHEPLVERTRINLDWSSFPRWLPLFGNGRGRKVLHCESLRLPSGSNQRQNDLTCGKY